MKFIFSANHSSFSAFLIRLFTWSKFNHVVVQISDHDYIEANSEKGVREGFLSSFFAAQPYTEVVEINVPNEAKAVEFLKTQLGKPYDKNFAKEVLFGGGNPNDWSAWFCSKLSLQALLESDLPVNETNTIISPGKLYRILTIDLAKYLNK